MKPLRILVFTACMLTSCAPGPKEIRHLGQLSQSARAACDKPGSCPTAVGCIRAVIDATRPGNVTRSSYKAATDDCDSFPVLP